jgi:hypothetical protein
MTSGISFNEQLLGDWKPHQRNPSGALRVGDAFHAAGAI